MESQPHILFISSWYPNRTNSTHGIFNLHFVKAASLYAKVSVLHVCFDSGATKAFECHSETKGSVVTHTVYLPKVTSKIPLWSDWLKRQRYLKAFDLGYNQLVQKSGRPQLIHLNVVMPAGIGVLHLHKKHRIPFVVNEGWTGYMKEDGSYKGVFLKHLTQTIIRAAARILPVSPDLLEAMQSHGLKGNYQVLPNVVQTDVFQPAPDSPPTPTFIHVSTFDARQKNVIGLLNAFKAALHKKPDLTLLLVGEGEDWHQLQNFVKTNRLEARVQFLGKKSSEELAELFCKCMALVMFSNYESFGVVIGEALSAGLPVICSRSGGLSSEITSDLGIVVQKQNEEQLTAAILNIAQGRVVYDKQLLREFVTRQFSEEVIAQKLIQVYKEVLKTEK